LGIAFGQRQRSSRLGGHRPEHVAPVSSRDGLELATGASRLLDLATSEHDLDVGGKQRRTHARLRSFVEHPADRGGRGVALPFRQAQQRQAGLRLVPAPTCLPVRLFGRAPLASEPVDLSLPVGGLPGDPFVEHPLCETLAGAPRLLESCVPGALQLHDLGSMHQADAGVGDHVGLLLAPAGQGLGPLAGAA